MTDKKLLEEQNAGSQDADVKEIQAQSDAKQPTEEISLQADAIKALQTELKNVKDILQSIESQSRQAIDQNGTPQTFANETVKQTVTNDFRKIDQLVMLGKLNPQQGAVLKNEVLQKAFGSNDNQTQVQPDSSPVTANGDTFTEFEKSNPDFFSNDARKLVKSFITNGFDSISPEELTQIINIIKSLEEEAIKGYEQSKARETAIQETNSEAKKRLASNALMGSKAHGDSGRTYTREEIGKMSPDEFRQNESAIMQQLRKGQIK